MHRFFAAVYGRRPRSQTRLRPYQGDLEHALLRFGGCWQKSVAFRSATRARPGPELRGRRGENYLLLGGVPEAGRLPTPEHQLGCEVVSSKMERGGALELITRCRMPGSGRVLQPK